MEFDVFYSMGFCAFWKIDCLRSIDNLSIADLIINLYVCYGCFFFSFRKMFSDNTRVIIFFFFCSSKHEIFFQNLTLDYMTKIPNQIIFFPPPKSESFFQQHWESEYFFLAKNHNPPPPLFKLNCRSLMKK